jgi:hypothetical protein
MTYMVQSRVFHSMHAEGGMAVLPYCVDLLLPRSTLRCQAHMV